MLVIMMVLASGSLSACGVPVAGSSPLPLEALPHNVEPVATLVITSEIGPDSVRPLPSPTSVPVTTIEATGMVVVPATQVADSAPTPQTHATSTAAPTVPIPLERVSEIGQSVQGRSIVNHLFGRGPVDIILVGGMHGGYEWNTTLLAYDFIDYFRGQPAAIPPEVTLHIIPNANPDGLYAVTQHESRFAATDVLSDTIPGRFNGNGVDLNRNWGCNWSEQAQWRGQAVLGGSEPFSEPEAQSLRSYFLEVRPAIVVLWHSAANGVFVAGCPDPDPASYVLAELYGKAASYPVYPGFTFYPVTGDASDWLASQGIPAFTVELTTHEALDWEQNLAGVLALMNSPELHVSKHSEQQRTIKPTVEN